MQSTVLDDRGETTYVLVFDKGDEVVETLTAFARKERLVAGRLTAIGAFSDVTLGYFDRQQKEYRKIAVREQVEVLSLIGDVAIDGDQPKIHAHVVVGRSDGTTRGGHLLEAHVWPTLEVVLETGARALRRSHDAESGLALIDLRRGARRPAA